MKILEIRDEKNQNNNVTVVLSSIDYVAQTEKGYTIAFRNGHQLTSDGPNAYADLRDLLAAVEY